MTDLGGKTAIVTGAGRGIGAAVASELAKRGAAVVIASRRAEPGEALAQRLRDAGHQATAIACDVSVAADIDRLRAHAEAAHGHLDILVNNAGVVDPIGLVADCDPDAWAAAIQVNLVGAFRCTRAVLPGMVAAGGGTIVNLSSGAAHRPLEGWSAYCAGKAGLAMLTRSLALEYADRGIRVFGFAPGVVDTDMQGRIRESGINPVSRLARSQLAPVDDPARAVAWLCGSASDPLSGQEIDIRDPGFRVQAGLEPAP